MNKRKLFLIGLLLIVAVSALAQTNFTAGEWSPILYGRVDLAKYYNGCRVLENFFIKPQGPAVKRPGTYYVADVKNHGRKVKLIPFEFSTDQAYVLEFGHEYIRYYMDNGQIESGDVPYEDTSPYQESELFEIDYAQTADTMYLVHPNHPPQKLTRTGHTAWTLTEPAFTHGGSDEGFDAEDHYPSAVEFFEQRLFFANTNTEPQAVWGSKSADYENFTTGADADDAVKYVIAASKVNAIRWLAAKDVLLMGTVGAEWRLGASNAAEPITPTNVLCRRQSTYGSAIVRPATVGQVVLFLQRAERKVREFVYNFEQDIYLAPDMNLLGNHITESGIVDMSYQQEPDSILWCVLRNGYLAAMTYQRDQEVVGWHRHITDGEVESVAVIPSSAVVNVDNELDYMEYVNDDSAQAVYSVVGKEVDYMEYASDGAAQTAYVSSDVESGDLLPTMTSNTAPSGVTSASDVYDANAAWRAFDKSAGTYWHSAYGTDPKWLKYAFDSGTTKTVVKYTIRHRAGNYPEQSLKTWTFQGSNNDSDWDTLDTRTDQAVWGDGELREFTFANSTAYRYYRIYATAWWSTGYLSIAELVLFGGGTYLQCYSESTIKEEGSYSLKIVANQDDSLADTMYHVYDPVLDLSGYETIKLDARATRAGQNFSIKIHDSEGTTTTHAVTISDSDVWQTDDWDISSLADTAIDAIDQILIEIDNADTENTFYLDNMYVDPTLQCYSDSAIIQQGTYSLRVLTTKELSEGASLRRSFDPVLNLSAADKINLYVYAYRAGSNFKLQIKSETTVVTSETDVSITDTDTWQAVEWDISGVATEDKEDIEYFYITITDDDAADTIYIDDVIYRDEVQITGEDQLWISVKRDINGVVKRFVEYLTPQAFDSLEDAFFVDCGLSYDSTPATVFSGLDHLIVEEVVILADGLVVDAQTVDEDGQITLTTEARKVHAGLAYTSKLQTLNLETGDPRGSQSRIKRIHEIFIRFKDSVGGKVGYDEDKLEDISGTILFNGDKRIPFPKGYERDYYIMITQPDPLPMTIISIMPRYGRE